jgi:hypothetical protein
MIVAGVLESDVICRLCGRQRIITERSPEFDKLGYISLVERQRLESKFGVKL